MTGRQLVCAAAICAGFAAFAEWRFAVPSVNEPHYLCKARHFSDPAWCARDLFLDSANAHTVFYAAFGPLTRLFSFEQTAWIGRVLMFAALALAWVRLIGQIVPGVWPAVLSACIFLALQATGNLSGEWLIGGVEAKGFSYAALLMAIAAACEARWTLAGFAAGVAISIHPVIGVWGAAALAGACLFARGDGKVTEPLGDGQAQYRRTRRAKALPLVICALCSLPGLVPAVAMLANRPSADEARRADEIQVFYRLPHHLDPTRFSPIATMAYGVMLIVWLIARWRTESNTAEKLFARFVMATAVIAAGGLAAGLWLRWPALMKFYPFRLFDLFLPIAVSITAAGVIERWVRTHSGNSSTGGQFLANLRRGEIAAVALVWCLLLPGRIDNGSRWPADVWVDFVDACRWIDRNTPADAMVLTPMYNVGFKCYAQRAEYVTWKDCPQDAAGILRWKTRVDVMKRWGRKQSRFRGAGMAAYLKETGAEYMLAFNDDPYRMPPVYRNRLFSVYVTHPARG